MNTIDPTFPLPSTRLYRPGQQPYEAVRASWNAAADLRPAAAALPGSSQELAGIVGGAALLGLRVAMQSTGHNAGALGDLSDAVLVRTSALQDLTIDPQRRTARVGAGVLWEPAVHAAAAHGLYPLHGSSPDVGIVGYSLGGGLGWLARRHGLQVNRIRSATVVTADGELIETSAEQEPELFWGLRGGSGLGIVTELEFDLLPVISAHAGWLAWDWADLDRVLERWLAWTAEAPETATTALRVLRIPPLPDFPPELRGRDLVIIDGALLEESETARRWLGPLRELRPRIDTFAQVPVAQLARLHGDPDQPTPVLSGHAMLGQLDLGAVSAFAAAAGPESQTSLVSSELRHIGGAAGRPVTGGGAVSHLSGEFLLFGVGIPATPELGAQVGADNQRLIDALSPWATGRPYANFTEHEIDPATFHDADTYDRLQRLRRAVDPHEQLVSAHAVRTAAVA